MKRLKKYDIAALGNILEVLNGFEMQGVIAGDGGWDCMFRTFMYMYQQQTGTTLNEDDLVQQFMLCTGQDPRSDGANIGAFMSFMNVFGYQGTQNTTGNWNEFSVGQWAAFQLDNSGILHFAIPTGFKTDKNGNVIIICIDPSAPDGVGEYPYDSLRGTFDVSPVPLIDSSISTGSYGSYNPNNPSPSGESYYA